MTNYIVTLPGTVLEAPAGADLSRLNDLLEDHDPRRNDGAILWTYHGQTSRFELRLTVEADTNDEAQAKAFTAAASALLDKGFTRLTAELDRDGAEATALD